MKTAIKYSLSIALTALAVWGTLTASADKPAQKTARNGNFIISPPVADPVYNQAGQPAVSGNTLLYGDTSGECGHRYPITAPDGHQVTLMEWTRAQGTATAKCVQNGTHVVLQLSGLIPHGLYTVWVGVFQAPGLPDFSNIVGLGALGAPDGSQNAFVASSEGKAVLSTIHPSGPLSVFDDRASTGCLLDEFEVALFIGLHLDGQTHGGLPHEPDNACTVAFPGGFDFKQ